MRYAIVENGIVINVIVWDGTSPCRLGPGCTLVQSDTANIGDTYSGGTFTPPPPPPPPPPQPDPAGFEAAAFNAIGMGRINSMMAAWPLFTRALDGHAWALLRQILSAALAANSINQSEYNQLAALLTTYNIPAS